ncbi:MAG: molecular chaperone HtpG [Chlorobi bacterium]|nr:molecular chaperone HtpG [Chlorobiota bacterium]
MQKGQINVTSENIFPIIKKFLYSDHEIFLRELISNAIDAIQKLKTLASVGDYKGEMGDLTIRVSLDKKQKTLTVSDRGVGMTADEIDRFINQIALSSAEEFLEKYKKDANAIIGHFGLGFYSSFMISEKVEIITRSYLEDAKAVKWSCKGTPEFTLEEVDKKDRGTDIILHIDDGSKEFLEESRIENILKKYCRYLPVEIAFGKEKEWKDDKMVETDKDHIINNTTPAWTRKPADLKEEDYISFYHDLYPVQDDPLFYIHLNVDYPFTLTGILYFPKIKNQFEIQKNKIQLYANQVFVTDSVEGIVPEFLTLLHGVLDSPDIPLNVSRSFLQNDSNVRKISSHITKKVADRLQEIFKENRKGFEEKWDDLKLFIEYGMLTDEKFYERAEKFALLKNTENRYFTYEEYEKLIRENQTDKHKNLIYLYATDKDNQYAFIDTAHAKGYDVLLMDGQLDVHFISHLESKFKNSRFVRVDADVIEKLVEKEEQGESKLTPEQKDNLKEVFLGVLPDKEKFMVVFENMEETGNPVLITQSEFMRRMKDMAELGGDAGMYGSLPETYNLVINANHPLILKVATDLEKKTGERLKKIGDKISPIRKSKEEIENALKDKKEEEIPQKDKDRIEELESKIRELEDKKKEILTGYARKNKKLSQLIDLALLANNMLRGEKLNTFVKRSIDLL